MAVKRPPRGPNGRATAPLWPKTTLRIAIMRDAKGATFEEIGLKLSMTRANASNQLIRWKHWIVRQPAYKLAIAKAKARKA